MSEHELPPGWSVERAYGSSDYLVFTEHLLLTDETYPRNEAVAVAWEHFGLTRERYLALLDAERRCAELDAWKSRAPSDPASDAIEHLIRVHESTAGQDALSGSVLADGISQEAAKARAVYEDMKRRCAELEQVASENYVESWCSECKARGDHDEDGCCPTCGTEATWPEDYITMIERRCAELERERDEARGAAHHAMVDPGHYINNGFSWDTP